MNSDKDKVNVIADFQRWCCQNDVSLDNRLEIACDPGSGIHIRTKSQSIPASTSVSYIPKRAVLSTKSCSLADTLPQDTEYTHGLGVQLMLALALYNEQ